jgi:hypothetical protein
MKESHELLALRGHTDGVGCVCFSPDGTRLASGSGDKTVKVWDAQAGKELIALEGHTGQLSSSLLDQGEQEPIEDLGLPRPPSLIPSQNFRTSSKSNCQQSTHKGRRSSSPAGDVAEADHGPVGRPAAAAAGLDLSPGLRHGQTPRRDEGLAPLLVKSPLPVRTRRPSGLKATANTRSS